METPAGDAGRDLHDDTRVKEQEPEEEPASCSRKSTLTHIRVPHRGLAGLLRMMASVL